MSAHAVQFVPHDSRNCGTVNFLRAQDIDAEECGTRIEVRCSCGWAQGCATDAQAARLKVGHLAEPDRDVVKAGPP